MFNRNDVIERVKQMEQRFDILKAAANQSPVLIQESAVLREHLRILTEYYESGEWLKDYELDEKGMIPEDLKRGVLSQDEVYHFLSWLASQEDNMGDTTFVNAVKV